MQTFVNQETVSNLQNWVLQSPPLYIWRWCPPIGNWNVNNHGRVISIPVLKGESDNPPAIYWEDSLTMYVTAPIGDGWSSVWFLNFNPNQIPTNGDELKKYLDTHIFIRQDYPEKTVPPPADKHAYMLYIPMTAKCCWMLNDNPYTDQLQYYKP